MRSLVLALVLVPHLASAAPQKLTLEQVIAKAVANPKVEMAISDSEVADARIDEAYAQVYPHIKASAFATVSPNIVCDNPECTTTSPKNFAFPTRFDGVFGGASLDISQLLYTFGKATHGLAAAKAGVSAQHALADEAAGDAAVDAARAYWGLKLARELGAMLDDGIDEIEKARGGFEERTDVTIQDKQRVAVLLAEAKAQRAEAAQAEAQALAGLRAITATPDADIDEDELAALEQPVPEHAVAGATKRPQLLAAKSGATAASELAEFQAAFYYPDLLVVGNASFARATNADDPPSAYANDPFNRAGIALFLSLQWQFEPWTVKAKTERLRAEARKAAAQAHLAEIGATYDAETAAAEARSAKVKVEAANEGEKAARTWLASVLQNQAVGTAEAKDLADAYIAWFQMKARWAQSVFQWNVAVVRLGRATGEFHAGPARPR